MSVGRGLLYLCTISRDVPVESTGRPRSKHTKIYDQLSCSFPQERAELVEGVEGLRQLDRFTFRVPKNADIRIGDRVSNIRDANEKPVFNDLIVLSPNIRRTHLEIRARRVS